MRSDNEAGPDPLRPDETRSEPIPSGASADGPAPEAPGAAPAATGTAASG